MILNFSFVQFDNYVFTNFIRNNKSFCLLTDGGWCLKFCLREEARVKGIKLAAHYSKYFDLRVEFKKQYPRAPTIESLHAMVNCILEMLFPFSVLATHPFQ
jgi:epithelial splicing regulatory protein 1/2